MDVTQRCSSLLNNDNLGSFHYGWLTRSADFLSLQPPSEILRTCKPNKGGKRPTIRLTSSCIFNIYEAQWLAVLRNQHGIWWAVPWFWIKIRHRYEVASFENFPSTAIDVTERTNLVGIDHLAFFCCISWGIKLYQYTTHKNVHTQEQHQRTENAERQLTTKQ